MRTREKFLPMLASVLILALTIFSVGAMSQSVALEKSVSDQEVYPGAEVTYTYTVTNDGGVPLTGVGIEDDVLGTVSGPEDLGPGEFSTYELTAEINDDITNTATATGTDPDGNTVEATAEVAVEVVAPEVYVDIKPTSCPNPLNTNQKGVVSVAILGSEYLGVEELIDEESVTLEGVEPLRYSYEDVAELYESTSYMDCSTGGPDGYTDLVFKFEAQDLVEALGELSDGESVGVELTGGYTEVFEGESFSDTDYVKILKKGNNGA